MDDHRREYGARAGLQPRRGLIEWRAADDLARRALASVDCDFDPQTRVDDLTRTEKSLVAIARALAVDCDFLVLDEPTASLPADEVERLFEALRPLRSRGVGMIYVSHRLDEVFRIADRVAVLRDGMLVGVRDVARTDPEDLVGLIVGRKAREISRPEAIGGEPVLEVSGLQTRAVGPIDLTLRRGELVGLVGLRGAGTRRSGAACSAPSPARARSGCTAPRPTSHRRARRCGRASAWSRATGWSN